MARKTAASGSSRRQATRLAVLAFVAADCVGIWYAQHRLGQPSPGVAQFAYETPGAEAAAPGQLTFTAPAPRLADAAPTAAVPPLTAAAPAPVAPALASAAPLPPAPALAVAPADLASSAAPARPAAKLATAPAPHAAHAAHAVAAPTPFDNAFALDGEAPDTEQRFGQGAPEAGGLADLLVPRDEPVPIFDKAGIAPVTGQAATVDAPADPAIPGEVAPADQPAIKG